MMMMMMMIIIIITINHCWFSPAWPEDTKPTGHVVNIDSTTCKASKQRHLTPAYKPCCDWPVIACLQQPSSKWCGDSRNTQIV
jgi:hypothetical protein